MDAAKELTRTYLQRVLRWWADKGPAAKLQIDRSSTSGSRSSALQWINAKSSYRDLSAQAEPQPKRGPRIRRSAREHQAIALFCLAG
ncbi:hypothetical protein DEG02_001300 [Xanthomonas vasicola]|nr:hypothetical protein KWO_000690 [Xanthomonas vasicola pv. musacearum NCPPB 4379]RJL86606.1 hypothetical protein DEG03_003595 [Xanthomonas vasicola]RRJ39896.1 hypothetical protein EIM46_11610 [Xanthomonas vasicola pv. musacearum]RJL88971.1 hypothetical protein DEF98_003730 [Xanthomonas vasicola]RJL91226.1 hypothetical protein DEF95_006665 [Xanthomonas vasicola]